MTLLPDHLTRHPAPRTVTDAELRAAGYTSKARDFPLSDAAVTWLCNFNGVRFDQAPNAWFFAPNPAVRETLERKGAQL